MNRQERLSALLNLVVEKKSVHIDDITEDLGISPATARRDLDYLASQQLVNRTRGGALANPASGDVPMRFRTTRNNDEKERIAAKAVSMIRAGDVIALNGGTTTTELAGAIGVMVSTDYPLAHEFITVVTNAVNIANDLAIRPQVRVVVTGGVARARSYELVGPLASLIFPHISVDILFLGVNALDLDKGLFTENESEAATNRALVTMARKTIVVADSTKLAATAFASICSWDRVDAFITDDGISVQARKKIEAHGVQVIIA